MIKARIQKPQAVNKHIIQQPFVLVLSCRRIWDVPERCNYSFSNMDHKMQGLIELVIRKLASRVKSITNMQNRTQSNIFHLMWCLEEQQLAPLNQLIAFMHSKKSQTNFNHTFFQKLKEEIFGDDIQKLNKLPEEDRFSNIHYMKRPYTIETKNEALPFKYMIQQLYPFPPQYAYKSTRRALQHQQINSEYLNNQSGRQTKKTIADFARKREPEHQDEQNLPHQMGVKKIKKINLLTDI